MDLPTKEVLASCSEGTAFLILAWQEMFNPYVPDTFQPRLLNLPLLIEEIELVARKAQISSRWKPHIKIIQEELKHVLQVDEAFLASLPYYHWASVLVSKKNHPREIVELATTLSVHKARYQQLAQAALQESVKELPKKKEAVLRALQRTATIAVNAGFRHEDFADLCAASNFSSAPDDWVVKLIERLAATSKKKQHRYRCTLAINADPKLLRKLARKLGFILEKPKTIPPLLLEKAPNASFLTIELDAPTPSEAVRTAAREVRPALDIFNFYSRSYTLTICDDALVSTKDLAPAILKVGAQSLRKLPSRRSADKLAARALATIQPRLLTGRILNALEHYTLTQTSAAYRVKLVNLWAAIECLATSPIADSVIERVRATVLPIVIWRRIDKITRYVATTLTQWIAQDSTRTLGSGFSKEPTIAAEEVLLVLCKPEDHPDIKSLLTAVQAHPLLRNRIFVLWSIFSNTDRLLKDMQISRQRTDWHLSRIYRARNLIVHDGEESPSVPHLLDHLQYYFSLTLSRILHSMSSHEEWTVGDAVAHWTARESYVLDLLARSPSVLKVRDFFPTPRRRLEEHLWE